METWGSPTSLTQNGDQPNSISSSMRCAGHGYNNIRAPFTVQGRPPIIRSLSSLFPNWNWRIPGRISFTFHGRLHLHTPDRHSNTLLAPAGCRAKILPASSCGPSGSPSFTTRSVSYRFFAMKLSATSTSSHPSSPIILTPQVFP